MVKINVPVAQASVGALTVSYKVGHPQIPSWKALWLQIGRRMQRLQDMYDGTAATINAADVEDEVDALLVCLDHLKDWLEHDTQDAPSVTEADWKAAFAADPLMLCADYANTFKHHTRKNAAWRCARLHETAGGSEPGVRIQIQAWYPDGSGPTTSQDALDFAGQCVIAWQKFLKPHGLHS